MLTNELFPSGSLKNQSDVAFFRLSKFLLCFWVIWTLLVMKQPEGNTSVNLVSCGSLVSGADISGKHQDLMWVGFWCCIQTTGLLVPVLLLSCMFSVPGEEWRISLQTKCLVWSCRTVSTISVIIFSWTWLVLISPLWFIPFPACQGRGYLAAIWWISVHLSIFLSFHDYPLIHPVAFCFT